MVRTATGSNGMRMSEPFWKLPSRRFYPDYYREIKNPICLGQIRRKLVKKGYGTLSEVAGDLTIMFENAKKYNIPTSKLYKVSFISPIFFKFFYFQVFIMKYLSIFP